MVDETSEDEVIRERAFRISDKLDIGDIVDSSIFGEKDVETDDYHEEDEALGDILDPFSNKKGKGEIQRDGTCLLYTSPSPRDRFLSRMPSSA